MTQSIRKTSIAHKLDYARNVIDIISKPDILNLLNNYGFTVNKVEGLEDNLQEVYRCIESQNARRNDLHNANKIFTKIRLKLVERVKEDIALCKIAFMYQSESKKFIPVNLKSSPFVEWFSESVRFYNWILEKTEVMTIVMEYKMSAENINTTLKEFEKLRNQEEKRVLSKHLSMRATDERNKVLNRLIMDCRKVVALAKLGLGNDHALIKRLKV
jgi:hypothetical protein